MEAGLMHFEEGALECLNPDLTVDDQAELLPYDKKWEFPRERLKLGKRTAVLNNNTFRLSTVAQYLFLGTRRNKYLDIRYMCNIRTNFSFRETTGQRCVRGGDESGSSRYILERDRHHRCGKNGAANYRSYLCSCTRQRIEDNGASRQASQRRQSSRCMYEEYLQT